jgi:hypothetical protein
MTAVSDRAREIGAAGPARTSGLQKLSLALVALGALLSVAALANDADRFSFAYLLGFGFLWTVVLGSLFFVALHHVTRAVWSVVIRRVAEMFAAPAILVVGLLIPLFVFAYVSSSGGSSLFPWRDAAAVEGDHVLEGKAPYLNLPFFILRGALFVGIWFLFARFFVGRSLRQDDGELGAEATVQMRRWSAPFMPIFALTVTFASFDWLMSLDPHWYSTIFGVYVFSGMVLTALAAITLGAVWLRAKGLLGQDVVSDDHLYSLGGLLFAFTCFWAYIAFSQFMLYWYGNIPEETVYFVHRVEHGWLAVSLLLVASRFVLPFFLLLSRPAKMDPRRLAAASVLVLGGQLVDLYWLIMPELHRDGPRLGWQELGPPLFCTGILLLYVARFLARHRALPVGDPLFEESRNFHL